MVQRRLAEKHGRQPSVNPAIRDALRRALAKAEQEAERMAKASIQHDVVELSNAGFALQDALAELWELRSDRGDDWADLLNMIQDALGKEEYERLTPNQCSALREIVGNHLRPATTDSDDIERTIQLLRRAGLDPWKGISGEIPDRK